MDPSANDGDGAHDVQQVVHRDPKQGVDADQTQLHQDGIDLGGNSHQHRAHAARRASA